MKSITILLLGTMIGSFPVRAADKAPDNFASIKWGENSNTAIAIMLNKPNVTETTTSPDGSVVSFKGGTFAALPATRWELTFSNNQFTKGRVYLSPPDTSRAALRKEYETIKKSIGEKYRIEGKEVHDQGVHSATYWKFKTKKGTWTIACDVDERTPGIFLDYEFNATVEAPSSGVIKKQKKDL